jgi:hypothetical protein
MQAQAEVTAARDDDAEQRRPAVEEELELPDRIRRAKLVQVVDHEHRRLLERAELGGQSLRDEFAVERRRRLELLHEGIRTDCLAERANHGQPEVLRVASD